MKHSIMLISSIVCLILVSACKKVNSTVKIMVINPLDIQREFETVSLDIRHLEVDTLKKLAISDVETQSLLITQLVDNDGDGNFEKLIFQPRLGPSSSKIYEIIKVDTSSLSPDYCYSRFVPERTDDYAWENDRVAFRTFGPTAQKMAENNVTGGTLSSGIDAWLKKVDYPIINKWYHKETKTDGTYHEDNGEGLDNFHVGISRGVAGTAAKVNGNYFTSKNFVDWETHYNGPIRASFVLTYEDWDANGKLVSEKKYISLDYGSNLCRFEISVEGVEQLSVGLTLHENDGNMFMNRQEGYMGYWQPHGDSELGTGVVAANVNAIDGFEEYISHIKDRSNLYTHFKVIDKKIVYYAGFGWKESGQFKSKKEWEEYLKIFVLKMNNPISVQMLD